MKLLLCFLFIAPLFIYSQNNEQTSIEDFKNEYAPLVLKGPEGVQYYFYHCDIKDVSIKSKQYKIWSKGIILKSEIKEVQEKLSAKYKEIKLKKTYEVMTLYNIDCQSGKLAVCRVLYYSENGEVISDKDYCKSDIEYEDLVPESMGEMIYNFICEYKTKL